MHETYINTNSIIFNAYMNNKVIILGAIVILIAFFLRDIVFTRAVSQVTSDVPRFLDDITINKVIIVLAPYIIALVLFYISSTIDTYYMSNIGYDAIETLSNQVIDSVKTTKKSVNVNDLIIHMRKISEFKNLHNLIISYIVPTIIVIFVLVYNIMSADIKMGIMTILVLVILLIVTMYLEYYSISGATIAEDSYNNVYDEIDDIFINIDTVITSNTKDEEINKLKKVINIAYNDNVNTEIMNDRITYCLLVITLIAIIYINYLSYQLYAENSITTTILITNVLLSIIFLDYYNYTIVAFMNMLSNIGRFMDAQNYFSNFKIIHEDFEHTNTDTKNNNLIITNGDIVFKNINLIYDNKYVYKNFDLSIKGKTKTCLIGPIGSGKSTLLKLFAGIINYNGDIYIDNQNLKNYSSKSIFKHIAYISQHPKLFNRSIYYNLNYGSNYTKQEMINKLNKLQLIPFINNFPNKLDTLVGKEGNRISGGQRQFIAMIRAILQNKSILLLDEPTSSLDVASKKIFVNLVKNLNNITLIVTTHDKEIYPLFDKIIDINAVKK